MSTVVEDEINERSSTYFDADGMKSQRSARISLQ